MAKDFVKILNDFKEEFHQEFKNLRESLERDIRTDIRVIRTELKGVQESMTFMNTTVEEIRGNFQTAMRENANLKKDYANLCLKCDAMEEELKKCQERLTHCEQYSRNGNIEIKGVEKRNQENLYDMLDKLGGAIGEPITCADIAACHRVPTRDAEKSNIIVQFMNRKKRDAVLGKSKKKRLINSDLGVPSQAPIFVNEHLCATLKRILGMAVTKKRQCNWKFVWVQNGKILARKAEHAPIITIASEADLVKIS
ncbi:uncharacterized protein ISCGN_023097 [Ixodes scapularis]